MPVNSKHAEYDAHAELWQRCRDAVAGGDTIKSRDSTYLPIPSGLTSASDRYKAYKARAKWFNATARTLDGLEGEVFRNDPSVTVPDALAAMFADYTLSGISATQAMRMALRERLVTGRYGELVDWSEEAKRPYVSPYPAESIINWRVESRGDKQFLSLVVLSETVAVPTDDEYVMVGVQQYRVLSLMENVYTVRLYREGTGEGKQISLTEQIVPRIRGQSLDYIPFQFYGVSENSPAVEKPPLLDLVDINIADYRNSADLEHGRHFCGLPMYYIFGAPELEDDAAEVEVGSTAIFTSMSPEAKAGVIEFSGNALGALEKAREENRIEMALLGARILEEAKMVGETAEALSRRQSGKQSVLQAMCEVQDQGHKQVLSWMARWAGLSEADIDVALNKDYSVVKLAAPELTALVGAWQSGAMSRATLFWNLQQGERIPPDRTADEEQEMIDAEAPVMDFSATSGGV